MTKSTCLILGTCFMLQALPVESSRSASALAPVMDEYAGAPLYSHLHARELLAHVPNDLVLDESERGNAIERARFIYKRTREMLPNPYKNQSRRVARVLIETANQHQMDPLFLMAVIMQESSFNPRALGSHGEIGLMQVKPSTARWVLSREGKEAPSEARIRIALKDPAVNIRYGAAYFAYLRDSFRGRSHSYIAAYNMGATKVRTHLKSGIQPREYSAKVLAGYLALTESLMASIHHPANDFSVREIASTTFKTLGL